MSRRRVVAGTAVLALLAALPVVGVAEAPPARAAALLDGFTETTVIDGLDFPTAVRFAPDDSVFVTEKSGVIKRFDTLSDTEPTVVADLHVAVHAFWDRGLLGLAIDPDYPERPYLYVSYTHDAPIGGVAPTWGDGAAHSDPCPDPPGATDDGCVVSGRLSRLELGPDGTTIDERVLVEDWCQQFPSHSVGDVTFGRDGALYMSAGDGASFGGVDYGQEGGDAGSPTPSNPCGDPHTGVGGDQKPARLAEGGALRAQDVRTETDPTGLDGTIIRVDPDTGEALPDNPRADHPDPDVRRIVANGFRNPYRITARPDSDELWVSEVGWGAWEEIDRLTGPADDTVDNYGWPCYEGAHPQPGYDGVDFDLCEDLYAEGPDAVVEPHFGFHHADPVVPGEPCPATGQSSATGVAFYEEGPYPDDPDHGSYEGALFFADYSRKCVWVMFPGEDGVPDPTKVKTFAHGDYVLGPVDVQTGPGGDVFVVDHGGIGTGSVRRLSAVTGNVAPTARISASPLAGPVPLDVDFSAAQSTDPNPGDVLTYEWDLDGDGEFDDSTAREPTWTYDTPGDVTVQLRVTDSYGASDVADERIAVDNDFPALTITLPDPDHEWRAFDEIDFAGTAVDEQDGVLPPESMSWTVLLHHCDEGGGCHQHPIQTFEGTDSGSFTAPEHEYPSWLELQAEATDVDGLTTRAGMLLFPETVELTFESDPPGLHLVAGSEEDIAPFGEEVIVNSRVSVTALSPQERGLARWEFESWSDGGDASHEIVAPDVDTNYVASYGLPDEADLALSADDAAGPFPVGGTAETTFTVSNGGPGAAKTIELSGAPAAAADDLVVVSATPSQGTCTVDPALACDLGSLLPGESATVAVGLTATAPLGGSLEAVAASATPDPAPGNEAATASFTFEGAACTKVGSAGNDWLLGTTGSDVLCGLGGNDLLVGRDGDDVLHGGEGSDWLDGGAGDDLFPLFDAGGDEIVIGGAGSDTVDFGNAPTRVRAWLQLFGIVNDDAGHGAVLSQIEELLGSPFDDVLIGDNDRDVVHGGGGHDLLLGLAGDDRLSGDEGNDWIGGGAGDDVCSQGAGFGPVWGCETTS